MKRKTKTKGQESRAGDVSSPVCPGQVVEVFSGSS